MMNELWAPTHSAVAALLLDGVPASRIGPSIGITAASVSRHIDMISRWLRVKNRAVLVATLALMAAEEA